MYEYRDAIMACPECKYHIRIGGGTLLSKKDQVKLKELPYVVSQNIYGYQLLICPHCRTFLGATSDN